MTIKIIGHWIAFYRQRIAASSWARKEMDIEILTTSRNGDTKINQSIRIGPPKRIRKQNHLGLFR